MFVPDTEDALGGLPAEDRARLTAVLHRVVLTQGDTLYECGQPVTRVYIPLGAVVEEFLPLSDGHKEPLRQIGRGGLAGGAMLADPVATRTARVTQSGDACCMAYADFAVLLDELPRFRDRVIQEVLLASTSNVHKISAA